MTEDITTEFENFMASWDKSFEGHKPAWKKEKKEKTPAPSFIPGQNSPYLNVWEAIEDHGVKRAECELFELKFNCVNNLITELIIHLYNGDELGLVNIQLTDRGLPVEEKQTTPEPLADIFKDVKF